MIQKFNQFVNENRTNAVSVYDEINEPVNAFIERVKERTKIFTERIQEIVNEMDKAIETAMTEFKDVIVSEPITIVDRDMSEISVQIHTNIPHHVDASNDEETPFDDLEEKVAYWLDGFDSIRAEVSYKPNDDGNCIITLNAYIINADNFGEFTNALEKFGEDY